MTRLCFPPYRRCVLYVKQGVFYVTGYTINVITRALTIKTSARYTVYTVTCSMHKKQVFYMSGYVQHITAIATEELSAVSVKASLINVLPQS